MPTISLSHIIEAFSKRFFTSCKYFLNYERQSIGKSSKIEHQTNEFEHY